FPPPPAQSIDELHFPPPPAQSIEELHFPPPPAQSIDELHFPPPPAQFIDELQAPEPLLIIDVAAFICFTPRNNSEQMTNVPRAATLFKNSLLD
ncbi:MAG: hypothetical protein IIT86_05205, partial [Oscillospiraceae bacterium]|nr:hypothetical protein [Oscillospiraceae bacterium]